MLRARSHTVSSGYINTDLRAERGSGKWWQALERGLKKGLHSHETWLSTFPWPVLIRAAVRSSRSFGIPLRTPEASGTYQRLNARDSISTLTMMGSLGANGKKVSTLNTGLISDVWRTHWEEKVNLSYPLMLRWDLIFR